LDLFEVIAILGRLDQNLVQVMMDLMDPRGVTDTAPHLLLFTMDHHGKRGAEWSGWAGFMGHGPWVGGLRG